MKNLLGAQIAEKYCSIIEAAAPTIDDLHARFEAMLVEMLEAGAILEFFKEKFGKEFTAWSCENNISVSHANKLIQMLSQFGELAQDLGKVNPLTLLTMAAPKHAEAREALPELIEQSKQANVEVTCADISALQKQHTKPKEPKPSKEVEPGSAVLIGNQQGGTGVFRIEAKEPELANRLHNDFKESGFATAANWLRFVTAGTRTLQDIASVVLGRRVESELELDELYNSVVNITSVSTQNLTVEAPVSLRAEVIEKVNSATSSIGFGVKADLLESEFKDEVLECATIPALELVAKIGNKITGLTAIISEKVEKVSQVFKQEYEENKGKKCVITTEPSPLESVSVRILESDSFFPVPLSWLDVVC